MCGTHGTRSFCDLAQDLAPHLLDTSNSPQELDLMLLLEAITASDVPAIRNLFKPAVTLPLWMGSLKREILELLKAMRDDTDDRRTVFTERWAAAVAGASTSRTPVFQSSGAHLRRNIKITFLISATDFRLQPAHLKLPLGWRRGQIVGLLFLRP